MTTHTESQSLHIRAATYADIEDIARVHIQSWKETYPGIMPAKKIASLSMEACTRNWQNTFDQGLLVYVALLDGDIVGFVSGGKNRQNSECETGLGDACDCELAAIYLLQAFHKHGIGRALFDIFCAQMRRDGYKTMVVWVAEKNPATGFYTALGGQLVDRKTLLVCEEDIPVVAYRYYL